VTTIECAVTTPNGIAAGQDHPDPGSYGNAQVAVGPFGLWPEGTVVFKPGGTGFITRDGSLGMKFGWRPGCWEVTGRVDDATVTFITRVVKIGDGPAWRRDVP
jgi:hypothetical protein